MKFGLKRTSVGRRVWTRQGRATCEWISPENPLRSRDAGVKPGGLSRGASAVRTCFLNPAPSSRADIPTHVLWLCAERVPAAGGIIPPSPPAEVSQTLQLTLGPVQPRRVGSLGCNVAPRSDPPFLCASGSSQAVLQPNPREGAGGGPTGQSTGGGRWRSPAGRPGTCTEETGTGCVTFLPIDDIRWESGCGSGGPGKRDVSTG